MYRVDGFEFETKEMAELAQKESDGIKYIKEQTRMDDPDVVLKLYRKLIDKQIFDTPVGYTFLYDLYEYLHTIPYIKNEDIPCIPVATHSIEVLSKTNKKARKKEEEKEKKEHLKELKQPRQSYRTQFRIALFFAIVFAVAIIGMFSITYLSGNNINIINYENELIDKYSSWEAELEAREAALEEKERD